MSTTLLVTECFENNHAACRGYNGPADNPNFRCMCDCHFKDDKAIHGIISEWGGEGTIGVMRRKIVEYITTIRQEERRAAFKDAIAAVPQVGVTFPEGYEEWIDAPSYRESVIAALEAAETKGEDGDDG